MMRILFFEPAYALEHIAQLAVESFMTVVVVVEYYFIQ